MAAGEKDLALFADIYEKFKPSFAVRTSMARMRKQDWIVNIPLWAIASL